MSLSVSVDFPEPGAPVMPDRVRAAGVRVQAADGLGGRVAAGLDERDQLGDRGPVAAAGGVDERARGSSVSRLAHVGRRPR